MVSPALHENIYWQYGNCLIHPACIRLKSKSDIDTILYIYGYLLEAYGRDELVAETDIDIVRFAQWPNMMLLKSRESLWLN